jgi:hypothetical protein
VLVLVTLRTAQETMVDQAAVAVLSQRAQEALVQQTKALPVELVRPLAAQAVAAVRVSQVPQQHQTVVALAATVLLQKLLDHLLLTQVAAVVALLEIQERLLVDLEAAESADKHQAGLVFVMEP